jgi:hypothetical protein
MSTKSILKKQIRDYVETADEKTLEIVHKILEACEPDPFDNMTREQKASLRLSLKQAAEGNVIPHEKVREEYKKWLTK